MERYYGDFRVGGSKPIGWELSWMGDECEARAAASAYQAIDILTREAMELARHDHPWSDDTGQLQEAIFHDPPLFHPDTLEIWARWGVRDTPRAPIPTQRNEREVWNKFTDAPITNKDVAMWLEFGTRSYSRVELVRSTGLWGWPFLYPAWNKVKVQLPSLCAAIYARKRARSRNPTGERVRLRHFSDLRPFL